MTKILVLHAGVSNKGSQALMLSTTDTVKKYIPDAEFTFMGRETNQNEIPIKQQLAFKVLKNPYPWLYLVQSSIYYLFKKSGLNYQISKNSKLYDYYTADVVINSGGDHLSGEKFGLSSLLNISYAILLDKPVVLYGESLGYYSNPIFNFIAKSVFNKAKLITVREQISKEYLDDQGVKKPKVYLTADSAFNLNFAPINDVLDILSKENIDNFKRPLIGINASGSISKFRGSGSKYIENEIASIFAEVIDSISEHLDATVILIPHVYSKGASDKKMINAIYDQTANKSKIYMIQNEYSASELKGIIGLCDLFIGARMHSTIASTSMLVPTVGIAYSHKMYGIIGQMLGQEKYILNINELESDKLYSIINETWESRDEIIAELKIKIPEIKEKALLNGKYVKELIDSLKVDNPF